MQKENIDQNMCCGAFVNGCYWIPNLSNLSETRTLCKKHLTDPMFSVIFHKTSIQKTMALYL